MSRQKLVHEVLELCCFEWFQNIFQGRYTILNCFRAVLFRMVPKLLKRDKDTAARFRAVLFRMVPKRGHLAQIPNQSFRAVLFRMVPKLMNLLKT